MPSRASAVTAFGPKDAPLEVVGEPKQPVARHTFGGVNVLYLAKDV
jgi:hypothetical protein